LRKRFDRQISTSTETVVADSEDHVNDDEDKPLILPDVRELDENFETAFQLAMNKGPLCGEPVVGMGYFLEEVVINDELDIATGTYSFHVSSD
jgi:translation elongation factor EF-G